MKRARQQCRLAIWLTLSLFIGAFYASLAATEGGGLRDGTWGKKTLLQPCAQSLTLKGEIKMPILLWLVGIPILLIILIMLLHH